MKLWPLPLNFVLSAFRLEARNVWDCHQLWCPTWVCLTRRRCSCLSQLHSLFGPHLPLYPSPIWSPKSVPCFLVLGCFDIYGDSSFLFFQLHLPYHTSALLSCAMESISLPYRHQDNSCMMPHLADALTLAGRKVTFENMSPQFFPNPYANAEDFCLFFLPVFVASEPSDVLALPCATWRSSGRNSAWSWQSVAMVPCYSILPSWPEGGRSVCCGARNPKVSLHHQQFILIFRSIHLWVMTFSLPLLYWCIFALFLISGIKCQVNLTSHLWMIFYMNMYQTNVRQVPGEILLALVCLYNYDASHVLSCFIGIMEEL